MTVTDPRFTSPLRHLLLLAGLGLSASALLGQLPIAAATPEAAPTEQVPANPELLHPRAAMTTFLSAFKRKPEELDGRQPLQVAAQCLDLSALPSQVRAIKGPVLAVELKDVIDRLVYVQLDTLPDEPAGPPFVFHRDQHGEIVIAPDAAGNWQFTSQTVASIPALLASVADRQLVEGVQEAPRTLPMWLRTRLPEALRSRHFLLETWQWLGLLMVGLLGWALHRLLAALIGRLVGRYLSSLRLAIDTEVLRQGLRPVGLLAMAIVWGSGFAALDLPPRTLQVLLLSARFLGIGAIVWTAYRLADVLSAILAERAAKTESRYDDLLVPMFRKTVKFLVACFGLLFLADNLDFDVSSLIAGLGIGGIAIALAAQDTVKNLFGSITVLMDRPFQVGDYVNVAGVDGTVEEVGFRSTRIRTPANSLVSLPNATLINASVDNYGARLYRRWKTSLALVYDTPPEKIEALCEGVRELICRAPHTRKEAYQVWFNEFGASSLDVLLVVFFEVPDYAAELDARHQLAVGILRLAKRLDVEFAYPTQTLFLTRPATGSAALPPADYADLREAAMGEARTVAGELVE